MYEYNEYEESRTGYEIVPYRPRRKANRFAKVTAAACLVAVCLGSSFGLGLSAGGLLQAPAEKAADAAVEKTTTYTTQVADEAIASEQAGITFVNALPVTAIDSVVDVVKQCADTVVSINVSGTSQNMFRRLQDFESAGSGIIIAEDSELLYIATNNHVIQNASVVTISVDDSNQVAANYVGSNYESDLAVISVTKQAMAEAGVTGYKIAATGNSDALEVGEIVVAIGNALGEGKSATMGIVSAMNKEVTIENRTLYVLQTDAAINPGNSGGALVNMKGQVIGINTAKLQEVGVEGMGYSIPIKEAMTIISEMIQSGAPEARPYLGIQGVNVDEQTRADNELASTGVYVYSVLSGSGAEAGGLRRGDIIAGFNTQVIAGMDDLNTALASSKAGETVELTIYRNNAKTTVKVTLKDANQKF